MADVVAEQCCNNGCGSSAFVIFLILILLVFGMGFCGTCI